ncbi:MAG: thioredoxin domain-containing protein [Flavobacteriia bacterium]|nr:thioredoxin domain-containing protein [Flavobacteriia bacterium]
MSNHLASSSSPYLLQHAHQPVNWYPWGEEALEKAKKENKLIIISVGYSTCHWCHVMAHETFDDDSAAAFMNEHFISIKVDREERPDIDQVYMRAVQMMTGQGGWPLNVVALPDGRPIWGGTYFPKDRWLASLERILEVRNEDPESVEDYAQKLQEGVQLSSTIAPTEDSPAIDEELFHVMRHNWSRRWDTIEGGPNKAPKFPLPNNYLYLMRYASQFEDESGLKQVELTLDAMAAGGIYDHVGGGFTRYSTDAQWRVPHFEKMLYDNGQLLELYANGYRLWTKESYADIILQTADFLQRELLAENGLYYSALDADTEGEEGKFYVWTNREIDAVLGEDAEAFKVAASWESRAQWEGENHVILKEIGTPKHPRWATWMNLLFQEREKREKPGVDTKQLSGWNALLISGLAHSALALDNPQLKAQALSLGDSFHEHFVDGNNVWHACGSNGGYISGFCDDYALTIKAYIDLHALSCDELWLDRAEALLEEALLQFNDTNSELLWYNSNTYESLISRSHETDDNVIPSSNAVMASNLFRMGRARGNAAWEQRAIAMTQIALSQAERYPEGFTQWAHVALDIYGPFKEVVVAGPNAQPVVSELGKEYLPNVILLGIEKASSKSPFENRFADFGTRIFVCEQRACQLPVEEVSEAIKLINQ